MKTRSRPNPYRTTIDTRCTNMNYCLICGKTDADNTDLCTACRMNFSGAGGDTSLDIARKLQNTSIPDMMVKGRNYSIELAHLMTIQDILVEVNRLETERNNFLASARMYHLLGNFFSVYNNQVKAQENYDKALRISPDNLLVLRERIRVLELSGREDEARNEKARLIQIQQASYDQPTTAAAPPPSPPPQAPPPTSPPFPPQAQASLAPPGQGRPELPPSQPPPSSPPPTPPQPFPPSPPPFVTPSTAPSDPGSPPLQQTPTPSDVPPVHHANSPPPATHMAGPYGSQSIPVPSKYSYKKSLLEHQSQQLGGSQGPTQDDLNRVNARVREVFERIGQLSSSGIETAPALEMLQKAQDLLSSSNTTEAMNAANSAVQWSENAVREHEEKCTADLVECQNLISNAANKGIALEGVQGEMELAINAYQNKNYPELENHIGSIKSFLGNQMNMGRYNNLLRELSLRINRTKEVVGPSKTSQRLDEILAAATEDLVNGRFDDLGRLIEDGDQLLSNIEESGENIKILSVLSMEVDTIREAGGDVEEISHELSLAEGMIGIDNNSLMMHLENGRAMIERIKNTFKEDVLSRQLSERRTDIEKLRELGMDVSVPESTLGNMISHLNQGKYADAEEGLGRVSGEILACYSRELGNLGERIEKARTENIPIPNLDENLSNTVNALNSQDISALAYHFSILVNSVNNCLLSLNSATSLEELFNDLERYRGILGETGKIMEISRLLERARTLLSRNEQEGAKTIMDQTRVQVDALQDVAELFSDISQCKSEIKEGNYPDEAVKDVKRELTIAERMLDTNIGFARNYVNNAKSMMEEVRSKFIAERIEGHLMKCLHDIEVLETGEADLSFAKALFDKISDISKEERYEEAEVLFEKLDEEIADLRNKVLTRTVQDRMVNIQTRMAAIAAEGVDLSEYNELLNKAIETMQWGENEKVIPILDEIEISIENQTSYKEVIEELKNIRMDLNELEGHGVDIKKAEKILMNARPELERGNYGLVRKYSLECREAMVECREQKQMLETLEHLYGEIEDARRARINVTRAMELAESAKNDIMDFNFPSAKDSIENTMESIRESVKDFHELTELVKLSRLKVDETREIGADISTLEAQYDDMMDLVSGGRYGEAKVLSKSIVERSLSVQLSYISSRSRPEPPSPPPPGSSEPAETPSAGDPFGGSGLPPLYESDMGRPLSQTPVPGTGSDVTGPGGPHGGHSVLSTTPIPAPATPVTSHPVPTISRPFEGSSTSSDAPSGSTTDLLAEIRNIYSKLDSTTIACPYCSGNIPRDSTFCSQCGKVLK